MNTYTNNSSNLAHLQCKPCTGATPPLSQHQIDELLDQLDGWTLQYGTIEKTYTLTNHPHAISFVNVVAWISNWEDHHPQLTVGYNTVKVEYTTHAINGLSENDFICAAKVDAQLKI